MKGNETKCATHKIWNAQVNGVPLATATARNVFRAISPAMHLQGGQKRESLLYSTLLEAGKAYLQKATAMPLMAEKL